MLDQRQAPPSPIAASLIREVSHGFPAVHARQDDLHAHREYPGEAGTATKKLPICSPVQIRHPLALLAPPRPLRPLSSTIRHIARDVRPSLRKHLGRSGKRTVQYHNFKGSRGSEECERERPAPAQFSAARESRRPSRSSRSIRLPYVGRSILPCPPRSRQGPFPIPSPPVG